MLKARWNFTNICILGLQNFTDMINFNFIPVNRFLLTIIIAAMTIPGYSQETPAYDKINTSAGIVEMYFIGHASLMFKVNGFIIFFDPVQSTGRYDFLPKADLILVTHEHGDHLDVKLINEIKKEGTLVFCNENSKAKIPWAMSMKAGDRQEINNIIIEAVPAYNIVNERAPGQPYHPKGVGIGYILTIGGKRFYVAGDTENIPEMKALTNIDVAFLPMNLPYTMTPEMVADAAKAFRPKILYPYHFGDTNTEEILKLLKDTGIEVRIRNLK
jgi:L-ascorbate metabolism protein UlaG (beta-lactamase superfamily)